MSSDKKDSVYFRELALYNRIDDGSVWPAGDNRLHVLFLGHCQRIEVLYGTSDAVFFQKALLNCEMDAATGTDL